MRYIKGLSAIIAASVVVLLMGCGKRPTGQDLERIYFDYHKALQTENTEALKNFITAERRQELTGEDAAMKISLIKEFLPVNIKVVETTVSGSRALLKVEGRMDDQKMTGEVEFSKEGGEWKIAKENWQMSVETETFAGTSSYTGGVKPFIPDPKKLPRVYQVLKGHQGEIYDIAFTPDNRYLLSAGYGDFTLRVWKIDSGEEMSAVRTKNRVRSFAVTPDGGNLLAADAADEITSWQIDEGILSNPRVITKNAGDQIAIAAQGKNFVTTGYRYPLQLWDLNTGTLIKKLSGKTNLRTLTFSNSGKYFANGSPGNTFTLWDTEKWKDKAYTIGKVSATSDVSSIDISNDDKYLATGHMDSSIVIFDLKKRREIHNFFVSNAATMDVKFTPDSTILATAQYDKRVYLWDAASARQLAALKGHSEAVARLAFSPDGTILASAGEDRQIFIWYGGDARQSGQVTPVRERKAAPGAAKPEMMELKGVRNLVKNPYANQGLQFWKSRGDVSIDNDNEGNPYFAVRYSGDIWQDVILREADAGRWALLISFSSSERINRDEDQTGLPYLYGYLLNRADNNRIDAYLQGQNMKHAVREPGKWSVIWGVFQVPPTSGGIRLFLQQADGRYAQNGSAANFDEPGIYLFDTEEEARKFAGEY